MRTQNTWFDLFQQDLALLEKQAEHLGDDGAVTAFIASEIELLLTDPSHAADLSQTRPQRLADALPSSPITYAKGA